MRAGLRRGLGVAVSLAVVLASGTIGPAGAATKNPCKLVKAGQIEKILGQPTAKGRRDLTTPVSATCAFDVEGTADKPEGGVYTYLQFIGADLAFETNQEQLGDEAQPVEGLGKKAFFQSTGPDGVVWVQKGDVLLTVQGVFFSLGDEPAWDPVELRDALIDIAKIARKKA